MENENLIHKIKFLKNDFEKIIDAIVNKKENDGILKFKIDNFSFDFETLCDIFIEKISDNFYDEKINTLEDNIDDLTSDIKDLTSDNEYLESSISVLETEIDKLNYEKTVLEVKIRYLELDDDDDNND